MADFGSVEWALDAPIRSISARLVLTALTRAADVDGTVDTPVSEIARSLYVERRTVQRCIVWLIEDGWLERRRPHHTATVLTLRDKLSTGSR